MNTIDRHIIAYVFGCLSGDFGDNHQSTKEIIKATEYRPDNDFLRGVLEVLKHENLDSEDVHQAVAEVALEYFADPHRYDEKVLYSVVKGNYFFTIHSGDEVVGVVLSNDFNAAEKQILEKFPKATFQSTE